MPQLTASPSIRDMQQYVALLEAERGFDTDNTLQKCLLLAEEVGELFKSIRKGEAGIALDVEYTHEADPGARVARKVVLPGQLLYSRQAVLRGAGRLFLASESAAARFASLSVINGGGVPRAGLPGFLYGL